jgi:hypothetical protein
MSKSQKAGTRRNNKAELWEEKTTKSTSSPRRARGDKVQMMQPREKPEKKGRVAKGR